ncbi:MAG: MerR family transcriptional regulator [Acidimicrobiales bacterium]
MAGRSHLSIGEVLSLLQEEFPDVTISKIRFLESQGLVDPERTPSGYRKFYEADIDRLRWVLRQQRDAFLPLKVIKGRLDDGERAYVDGDAAAGDLEGAFMEGGEEHLVADRATSASSPPRPAPGEDLAGHDNGGGEPGLVARKAGPEPHRPVGRPAGLTEPLFDAGPPYSAYGAAIELSGAGRRPGPESPAGRRAAREVPVGRRPTAREVPAGRRPAAEAPAPARSAPEGPEARPAGSTARAEGSTAPAEGSAGRAGPGAVPSPSPRPGPVFGRSPSPTPRPARTGRAQAVPAPGEDDRSLEELANEPGIDVETVRDLERFGLITPKLVGSVAYYSQQAAVIAQLASAFARHGVEARHLRAYKGAVDREAGMVQQVIMPLIRQRNPEARQAAAQAIEELSRLGGELRAALLRAALADLH